MPEGEAAETDDQVVIDFVGTVDGEEFEGGKAEGFNLTLGSGQLIPGFEDQLVGAKAGEARDVKVKFPDDYGAENLAGKDAVFAVTVKAVKKPDAIAIDDELAKRLGLDSLGHAQGPRAGAAQERLHARQPAASEAPHPRRARRRPHLPAAADHGRRRVRRDLEPGPGRAEARRQDAPRTRASPKTSSRRNITTSPSAA